MISTFKGRGGIWTKRNKADFGEFIQVSNADKLRINFGLFVKAKNRSIVDMSLTIPSPFFIGNRS